MSASSLREPKPADAKQTVDDADLLRNWKAGERRAGAQLYRRHSPAVGRFFRNKVEARDIPDLIQSTFLTCLEVAGNLREEDRFRAFLLGVARNTLFAHYRRSYRTEKRIDFGASSLVDLGVTPTSIIAEQQHERLLLSALRALPIEQQIMLELYYWEGMRGPELASFYEIPDSTARTRVRRARLALQAEFEAQGRSSLPEGTATSLEAWASGLREKLSI